MIRTKYAVQEIFQVIPGPQPPAGTFLSVSTYILHLCAGTFERGFWLPRVAVYAYLRTTLSIVDLVFVMIMPWRSGLTVVILRMFPALGGSFCDRRPSNLLRGRAAAPGGTEDISRQKGQSYVWKEYGLLCYLLLSSRQNFNCLQVVKQTYATMVSSDYYHNFILDLSHTVDPEMLTLILLFPPILNTRRFKMIGWLW